MNAGLSLTAFLVFVSLSLISHFIHLLLFRRWNEICLVLSVKDVSSFGWIDGAGLFIFLFSVSSVWIWVGVFAQTCSHLVPYCRYQANYRHCLKTYRHVGFAYGYNEHTFWWNVLISCLHLFFRCIFFPFPWSCLFPLSVRSLSHSLIQVEMHTVFSWVASREIIKNMMRLIF